MKIIDTTQPLPESRTEGLHVYDGLDCCITLEVFDVIAPYLDSTTRATYSYRYIQS